ncbi:ROK family protein [Hydrogenimonas sp.]
MSRLAVDIGGTWLRYEVIGEEEACAKIASSQIELGDFLRSMLERYPDIDAVAVSFAGQVHEGTILSAPNIEVKERNIEEFVENRFGVPLRIENDLNCAALAEAVYWNEKELVALYAGTGLGSGIVTKGEILHGWRSLAGEIGHIPFKKAPFRCGCGKDNCLELYASGSGLKKWAAYLNCHTEPGLEALRRHERTECRDVAKMFDEALARAVATAVTLLNPKILVLGGGVIRYNPEVVEKVKADIGAYALAASCEGLKIEASRIEDASLEGAKLLLDTI